MALVAVIAEPMIRAPAEISATATVWSGLPPDTWLVDDVTRAVLADTVIVTVRTTADPPPGKVVVTVRVRDGTTVTRGG